MQTERTGVILVLQGGLSSRTMVELKRFKWRYMKTKDRIVQKKKPRSSRRPKNAGAAAGQHTQAEIFSQPILWRETAEQLARHGTLDELSRIFSPRSPWLFVACGSSYYLSQLTVAVWQEFFKLPCAAVPASEFLFATRETLQRTGARHVVLVSRSGETTEVLRAAEILKAGPAILTLGVTCSAKSTLENLCRHMLKLAWADEQSTVMTRSFTSMLMAFERLGAALCGESKWMNALDGLPEKVHPWLKVNAAKIQGFGGKRRFADLVFLGQGAHYWLAQEAALKVTEMSSSYAQAYHTLEFRHGPRSITSRNTLITFLISDAAKEEETLLVSELKELGAATLVVVNHATPELARSSDLLIELGLDGPEFTRLAPAAIPAQLLGAAIGLRKGLNPDAPKNLSRVVTLPADNGRPMKRSGA
jgi:glucosamine--fructose-6-phosphate aminotransferase (isomerizing)